MRGKKQRNNDEMRNGCKGKWSPTIGNGVGITLLTVTTVIANNGRWCGEWEKNEIRKKWGRECLHDVKGYGLVGISGKREEMRKKN